MKHAKAKTEKVKGVKRPREQKVLGRVQRAKVKEIERRILKAQDYDRHRKAHKKIGRVRGRFHPSLPRTRKRT